LAAEEANPKAALLEKFMMILRELYSRSILIDGPFRLPLMKECLTQHSANAASLRNRQASLLDELPSLREGGVVILCP
jgi:hypothetical protein